MEMVVSFADPGAAEAWQTVNDGVMGGVSTSRVTRSARGDGVFEGVLSRENNGGFASARVALPTPGGLSGHTLAVLVRGDGKRYQVRLHTAELPRGASYRARFDTVAGEWREVRLPFAVFRAANRGHEMAGAPALDPARVASVGFLVGDGQEGLFRLEIRHVGVMQ
jgi:monofunctional biosynthetic peptidoglycan transglycosylase